MLIQLNLKFMRKFCAILILIFLAGGLLPAQTDSDAEVPPRMEGLAGLLLKVSGPMAVLPLLPENQLEYYRAEYSWPPAASPQDSAFRTGADVEVYVFKDDQDLILASTVERSICEGLDLRFAVFEDRALFALGQAGEWVLFSFPDRDLEVCDFIGSFMDLYSFFRAAAPEAPVPPFPGVLGYATSRPL